MKRNYQNLIDQMTIYEKAALLIGKNAWDSNDIPHLHIPSITCSDGPHGLRRQGGVGDHLGLNASLAATCFPTAATIANSWDEALGEQIGIALGTEAKHFGVDVLLGPGINMKRNPLCGRNFEYFSEDPYLAGKMAAAYVRGIQQQGVASCIKHFAVNSQETIRMAMNARLDERTLRELYLTAFEIAVKEGDAKAIMSSYNEVNGIYTNENKHLLTDILREEWGFNGIVISDWGGCNRFDDAVRAGSNLQMPAPGFDTARQVVEAVKNGTLSIEEVNDRIEEQLRFIFSLKENTSSKKSNLNHEHHHQLAYEAATKSIVLLKNNDNLLPLDNNIKIVVVGDFAFKARYQGAGSSLVNSTKVESVKNLLSSYPYKLLDIFTGYDRIHKDKLLTLTDSQKQHIQEADVILYFFGLTETSESEGVDRSTLSIPTNQIDLLNQLSFLNDNIVGILSGGAAIEMPWENQCKAILHGYLNGQAGASAILDILCGKVNPSGKLAETFPIVYEDIPTSDSYPTMQRTSDYKESIYIGYRYFDTRNIAVRYPFGYGLSYTSFQYDDLIVDENGVSFTITNTGLVDGREIAQLYISYTDSPIYRPKKELKGFTSVYLQAKETKRVQIPFDDKTFRFWNSETNTWQIQGGQVRILIGKDCKDIVLSIDYTVPQSVPTMKIYNKKNLPHYFSGNIQQVSDEEYATLLGYIPQKQTQTRTLSVNDPLCYLKHAYNPLGRLLYKHLEKKMQAAEATGNPDLNIIFQYNMTFRSLANMSSGLASMDMVEGIVHFMNGKVFTGLSLLIYGAIKNGFLNTLYRQKLKRGIKE